MTFFKKLLIANRGEIACRVIRTAKALKIPTVAVFSDADRDAVHVKIADESEYIGGSPSAESYLSGARILDVAAKFGADAIHPGYGFLSENAAFANAAKAKGIAFIGPSSSAIEAMGDKIASKKIASKAGVSVVPGHLDVIPDAESAVEIARGIGFPVMIKASAGGGGKGMRIAWNDEEVREGYKASRNEAKNAFGDDRIFIEKFVTQPRHIEIQILGDQLGGMIYLGERECSIQRRNQKVIEEAPSPFLDGATRKKMGEQAVALGRAVGYQSAGTVEFIVDSARNFYFLEMNTRLQVEHPVTELITGLDLVEEMIRVAAGQPLRWTQEDIKLDGWAVEARVYAEDPYRNFLPSIGRITRYRPPAEVKANAVAVRNDSGVEEGSEISIYYDPMISKLCTWAPTRLAAIDAMSKALDDYEVEGIRNNLPFLSAICAQSRFRRGELTTNYIAEEFPEGFSGVRPTELQQRHLAAVAAHIDIRLRRRALSASGRLSDMPIVVDKSRVISFEETDVLLTAEQSGDSTIVWLPDGMSIAVQSDWVPGKSHAVFDLDGYRLGIKTDLIGTKVRLRVGGIDLTASVRSTRVAELARLMPRSSQSGSDKRLLSPMPGVLTLLSAVPGQKIEPGQAVATVEAMKMENVLRAEKGGTVKVVAVAVGANLSADQLILEFE